MRRLVLLVAVLVPAVPAVPAAPAGTSPVHPCDAPTRRLALHAQEITVPGGPVRLAWATASGSATIPGPLIEMTEGECLAVTVVNDVPASTLQALRDDPRLGCGPGCQLPLGISLHVHGVKYTRSSDGTLVSDSASGPTFVPSGHARTFLWYAAPRVAAGGRLVSQGTAGYWWYHDHVAGTSHGTGGLASGLFGGLVVRRPGDLRPDVTHTVVMGPGQTINLERHPRAPSFTAVEGQRVEFVVIGVGDDFHTFHLHGHNWADNRTGILSSQADETALIDNRTLGPADSFGFQVIAGQQVGPGRWMLHCHVQSHSDAGMVSFFEVAPVGGTLGPDAGRGLGDEAGHGDHI